MMPAEIPDQETNEIFFGYCYPEPDGWHTPAVTLQSPEEVLRYTQLQGKLFREVRITDEDDCVVAQIVDGKYTWPEEWKRFNDEATRLDNQTCYICGCTDDTACFTDDGPCYWINEELCSACYAELVREKKQEATAE